LWVRAECAQIRGMIFLVCGDIPGVYVCKRVDSVHNILGLISEDIGLFPEDIGLFCKNTGLLPRKRALFRRYRALSSLHRTPLHKTVYVRVSPHSIHAHSDMHTQTYTHALPFSANSERSACLSRAITYAHVKIHTYTHTIPK